MGIPLTAGAFYDQLSSDYHLLYGDWELAIERQARAISGLLPVPGESSPLRVLDCACGIGTQTIGLAKLGFHMTGVVLAKSASPRRPLPDPAGCRDAQRAGHALDPAVQGAAFRLSGIS
jgi:hypothetical protein